MAEREYIDFKLYLTKPNDEGIACQVALLPTPEVGESMRMVDVPADRAPKEMHLKLLAQKTISPKDLLALGKSLADCLLPEGEIRNLFREAHKYAGNEGGVRLRLIIAHDGLRQWPWEYTYLNLLGKADGWFGFLALDPRISFVRHEPLATPHSRLQYTGEDIRNLRMILAAAQPQGTDELALEKEIEIVTRAVDEAEVDGVRIVCSPILRDATYKELANTLHTSSPYIFHFAGHGITKSVMDDFGFGMREQGYILLLEDEESRARDEILAEDLADVLAPAGVRLVVMGACLSGTRSEQHPWDSVAGALVAHQIPAVVAMQYEVIDDHALSFSETFYTTLASGLSLDEAMSVARREMSRTPLSQTGRLNVEWGVPVLYSRSVDGKLFPERVEHAGESARSVRRLIKQDIKGIDRGGEVVAARARQVKGGIQVVQEIGFTRGLAKGLEVQRFSPGSIFDIQQSVEEVEEGATVIGLDVDEL